MTNENLGPAEKIINTVLNFNDHLYHGRPGVVTTDARATLGVKWAPVTHKEEDGKKIVYRLEKHGAKNTRVRVGELRDDNFVYANNVKVGEYRKPGLFPEAATWLYQQATEVWKLDNEFAAKWASYAYSQDHRDLKAVLAALMLVQSRKGDPIRENDEIVFYDDDHRDVGEAMVLILRRKDNKDFNPKQLLRIHDLLSLPQVAQINRELGFGRSARKPFLGRWNKAVEKWLRYREENLPLLSGLVKAGYRQTVMELARRTGYKPSTQNFFETLRWKQVQSKDGRRSLAIGQEVAKAETWEGLSEVEICEKIVQDKPNYKRIVGLIPKEVGITRAVLAAAIESKCLSKKDLIIQTPTLEQLGLLNDPEVKNLWEQAVRDAEDMRAANIAARVKNKATKEKLEEAADNAVKAAVEEEMKNIRVYFMVDVSGSMTQAIEEAKHYLEKFLQAFPPEQIHVAIFNTIGRVINIKTPTGAGVRQAFIGQRAGGGTDISAGIRALHKFRPKENEDVIFFFVSDQGASDFPKAVRDSGLNPMAFGHIQVGQSYRHAIENTARTLGIPCFMINKNTFNDVYAVPRTIKNLIMSTPINRDVGKTITRKSLVEQIIEHDLLQKPIWAQSA
ncbi:MAG: VWA domain-containing protein [SAR86 cluster bacterium]|nr:VWA domain-containing protein [SAR86 cluster bacterium]